MEMERQSVGLRCRALRGAVTPCDDHYHYEAVALLQTPGTGAIVAHLVGKDVHATVGAALRQLRALGPLLGAPLQVDDHEDFAHSDRAEVAQLLAEEQDEKTGRA